MTQHTYKLLEVFRQNPDKIRAQFSDNKKALIEALAENHSHGYIFRKPQEDGPITDEEVKGFLEKKSNKPIEKLYYNIRTISSKAAHQYHGIHEVVNVTTGLAKAVRVQEKTQSAYI